MSTVERAVPWVLRLAWVGVLVLGGRAVDAATADRGDAIGEVARLGGGLVWVLGVAAMAIPAVVSLTATRSIVPLSVPASIVAWVTGAGATDGAAFTGVAVVATLVAFSAELGRVFVQSSAYGDEDRHLLRPPLAYAVAAGITWLLWAGCVLAGPLLLADRRWIAGSVCSALAVGGAIWAGPRWHRLTRRWFVIVPVGVVVHDHLVLAETLMLRRRELAAVRLAPLDTEAADFTGPTPGHAIEVLTTDPVTAIFAATRREPRGRAIHLTGCLVSPSRPGRLLAAASARHLPVG